MDKRDIVKAITEKTKVSQATVDLVLRGFVAIAIEQLKQEETIKLRGFGAFDVANQSARAGRNPRTGEAIKIPACKRVRFKASSSLKALFCSENSPQPDRQG